MYGNVISDREQLPTSMAHNDMYSHIVRFEL